MLTMYKEVFFGQVTHAVNRQLHDLSAREVFVLVPIVVLIFWIGLFPKPFLDRIEPTTEVLVKRLHDAGASHLIADEPSPDVQLAERGLPPAR
jgi:NADH-quinone oxidoreductase subunit M